MNARIHQISVPQLPEFPAAPADEKRGEQRTRHEVEQGRLAVIYSPYDLEGGWNEVRYPLSRGYQSESAKQLGCNIIMFAMTDEG